MSDSNQDFWQAYQQGKQKADLIIQDTAKLIRTLYALVRCIMWLLTMPATVFLHHSFGERYFNFVLLLITGSLLASLSFLFGGSTPAGKSAVGFAMLYVVVGSIHMLFALRRGKKGIRWHSRSSGLPYPFWRYLPGLKHPFTVEGAIEPLLVCFIGIVWMEWVDDFGVIILGSGICLLVEKSLEARQIRNLVLDQIDQTIEAEFIQDMIEAKRSPWEGEGFVVPEIGMKAPPGATSVAASREAVGEQFPEVNQSPRGSPKERTRD